MMYVFHSVDGEDYLADLFLQHLLITKSDRPIFINSIPSYIWDDYPQLSSLYGSGFTAFGNVFNSIKGENRFSLLSKEEMIDSIRRNVGKVDIDIIYTSVWRESFGIHELSSQLGERLNRDVRIIALDGEDHEEIFDKTLNGIQYYKRELNEKDKEYGLPISFKFPVTRLPYLAFGSSYIPIKKTILAPCDPRWRQTYNFRSEKSYYHQYSSALFAVTTKKGGWDCMRHYEILANHCIPYFPDISLMPSHRMIEYPRKLQLESNQLFLELISNPNAINSTLLGQYHWLLKRFLDIFYSQQTTINFAGIYARDNLPDLL